ncbi:PAS domain S-box protein [Desulfocurvibacter africanus]|uniref:hybrid sensor histidine kinase/response regulator n=1 Tax=Desulfocurvibacter africanus TaxID=873 RepID=UPI0003FFFC28|nr:PAS domain S-box protein [Desulfocurvibacter africanus]
MDSLHMALLAATTDQIAVLDTSGVVLMANTAMCERLGIAEGDLIGRALFNLFPKETAAKRKRRFRQALSMRQPVIFEDVLSRSNNFVVRVVPILRQGGQPECAVISVRNTTASFKAEQERVRLVQAIEQAVEAFILLSNDLNIEYVNQAFEEMTGFAQQEIKGKNIETLYTSGDQKRVLENTINSLEYSETWMGRTTNTRKNGVVFKCEQTFARIRGKRYRPLGYVSVWRDITEMEQLERQLRQAQKMEALGMLAGGIAHDFNNILGPIILHAELNMQGLPQDSPIFQGLEEILGAAQRARGLIDHILGLSRKREKDQPLCFQLSSLVKECLKLLRPSLPSDIRIVFENRSRWDLILADPTQVHQVIMNLATNAAQAMQDRSGELSITLSEAKVLENQIGSQGLPKGRYIQLEMRDTGPGIAPENLERIFDPFFTTKKEDTGTGLGLAVVRTIMNSIGGNVRVESTPGNGATFRLLFLSCVPEKTARRVPLDREEHMLLVDDDPVVVQGSRGALEQLGFTVTACRSAFEALAYFRKAPEQFDVCICEASMSEMGGVELARELLLNRPDLPIVLSFASHAGLPMESMAHLGISACIRTPFRMDDLRKTLTKVLGSMPATI